MVLDQQAFNKGLRTMTRSERRSKIVAILKDDPWQTMKEIRSHFEGAYSTISLALSEMKTEGILISRLSDKKNHAGRFAAVFNVATRAHNVKLRANL
jgi:predicted HTH transcriptional regulator